MQYQKYSEYKKTNNQYLKVKPKRWFESKVKYIADYINGYAFSPKDWDKKGKKIIRIQNLNDSNADYNYFNGEIDEKYKVRKGDILLSWSASLGVYIWEKEEEALLNQHIYKVIPNNKEIAENYFKWISKWFLKIMESEVHGSTMKHITKDKFGNFDLILPPKKEQEKISEFLDTETSRIDNLIEKKEKLIELLEEKRQAVITHHVTKGLNPNVPMKDSGVEWLGEIPEHWDIKPLKYCVDINLNTLSENTNPNKKIIYIDIGSVNSSGIINEKKEMKFKDAPSRARRVIQDGDTIVSTVRTYLKAVTYFENISNDLICSTGFAVLTPTKEYIPKFLYYWVRSTDFIDEVVARSVGVSYPAINTSELGRISAIVPPINEQKQIVDYLNKEIVKLNNLENEIEVQISNLKEYRQALITNAVTGKIDVRDLV